MPPPSGPLPWDVLLLVFKEADPSTLAILGGVSLDFLASTASILYRDVELTSVESLNKLFCEREQIGRTTKNSSHTSRIKPHLDLDRIRNLYLNFKDIKIVSEVEISSRRIHQALLLLDSLQISYDHAMGVGLLNTICEELFHHLNPLRCAYRLVGKTSQAPSWLYLGPTILGGWTRVQELDFKGGWTYSHFEGADFVGGLWPPSLLQRRTVRLHVASLLRDHSPSLDALLDDLAEDSRALRFSAMQEGSIKLVVQNEEEVRDAKEVVRTNEKIASWRSIFAVEIETRGKLNGQLVDSPSLPGIILVLFSRRINHRYRTT